MTPPILQKTGPHLFEFSPAGTAFEYYAHSIGARSQSAKTYLEKNFESFEDGEFDSSFDMISFISLFSLELFPSFCPVLVQSKDAVLKLSQPPSPN